MKKVLIEPLHFILIFVHITLNGQNLIYTNLWLIEYISCIKTIAEFAQSTDYLILVYLFMSKWMWLGSRQSPYKPFYKDEWEEIISQALLANFCLVGVWGVACKYLPFKPSPWISNEINNMKGLPEFFFHSDKDDIFYAVLNYFRNFFFRRKSSRSGR